MQTARTVEAVQSEHSRRIRILEFVETNPGSHFRRIKRELGLPMGVLQYHLYRLEKEKNIVGIRRGLYKRFYPRLDFEAEQQTILGVLFQETERDLLLYLLENPNTIQKELSEYARISSSSTHWHMKRLVRAGLVDAKRKGGFVYYTVKGEPARIVELLKNYHPRIWDRWAERLADLLT